jgi:hypothetical protein
LISRRNKRPSAWQWLARPTSLNRRTKSCWRIWKTSRVYKARHPSRWPVAEIGPTAPPLGSCQPHLPGSPSGGLLRRLWRIPFRESRPPQNPFQDDQRCWDFCQVSRPVPRIQIRSLEEPGRARRRKGARALRSPRTVLLLSFSVRNSLLDILRFSLASAKHRPSV